MIITSSPHLQDPNFQQSTIVITEHNEKGAIGFVINKLFTRKLNELEEFKISKPFPIYDGGPVDKEHLFFIHRRPDIIEDGTLLFDGIYYGGNFQQAVANINSDSISTNDIKILIGYCGWDNNELQEEIEEGSWIVQPTATAATVFVIVPS